MFETEVFRKQMCCFEGSICDIVRTFRRPHSDSAPGELYPPLPPSLRPCQRLRIPSVIRPVYRTYVIVVKWNDELLYGGHKWVSRFERPCIRTRWTGERWVDRCPGSVARCARDSVATLRQSSADWMPTRIEKLSAGVGLRHPVTIRKASLMAGLMKWVWALRNHTVLRWNVPGLSWRLATLLLQHPSQSQQAASRVRRVIPAFCEVTQGAGDAWATCPAFFRGIWARSRRAGILLLWLTFSSRRL